MKWEGILISSKKGHLFSPLKISAVCIFIILIAASIPLSARCEDKTLGTESGSGVASQNQSQNISSQEPAKSSENGTGEPGGGDQPAPNYEYQEPEFAQKEVSYPLLILRTVAVLGVIIIGIYLIFRLLLKNRRSPVKDSEIVQILATYPLAANRLIQIVDIGGQILVLGVSDSNVNLITEIDDKEVIDRIRLLSSKESRGAGGFKEQFLKLIGGKSFSKPGQISYLGGYKKRIDRMKKM
jgi:flagellar biogenesis protein FliO